MSTDAETFTNAALSNPSGDADAALAGSAALAGTPLELASTARTSVLSGGTVLGAWPCDRWRARLVGELCA